MGNGMRRMQGTREMSTGISGNVPILVFRGILEKILGNVIKDSRECSRRFPGMLSKIPGNVPEDFGECYLRFLGIFQKIPGNLQEDSGNAFNFKLIKAKFYCNLALLYLMN